VDITKRPTPEEIITAQLELTTRCNQKCRFCTRQRHQTNRILKDIDFDVIKNLADYKRIALVGPRSEPTLYPLFMDAMEIFKERNTKIQLFSNMTTHNPDWWYKLGVFMKYEYHNKTYFAIDLEEDWQIYRGVDTWHKMVENVKAFTAGGGIAWAHLIEFAYNQDKIKDIEKLARHMGCTKFRIKNSWDYDEVCSRPVSGRTRWELSLEKKTGVLQCQHLIDKDVVIDVSGNIVPCCYTLMTDERKGKFRDQDQIQELIKYEKDSQQGKLKTLESALNSSYFNYIFDTMENSWNCKLHCKIRIPECYIYEKTLNVLDIYNLFKDNLKYTIPMTTISKLCNDHSEFYLVDVFKAMKVSGFIDFNKLLNVIVKHPDIGFFNSFGVDHIISKRWLVDELTTKLIQLRLYRKPFMNTEIEKVLVVAGWQGLTSLLINHFTQFKGDNILSIDIDPISTEIAQELGVNAVTADMNGFDYTNWDIIINSSCEHIDIKNWLKQIPTDKILALQSTDMYWGDHINVAKSLEHFEDQIREDVEILHSDKREKRISDNLGRFDRFLIIGRKK